MIQTYGETDDFHLFLYTPWRIHVLPFDYERWAPRSLAMTGRLLSYREAQLYCGVSRNRFDNEIRPYVTIIPSPGANNGAFLFDRLELDDWIEQYKTRHGRPGAQPVEQQPCEIETTLRPASRKKARYGTSTKRSGATVDFVRVLEQVTTPKRSST
jgi:hypothetical protein